MKIGQKEIYRIAEIALTNFRDLSPNLSWVKNRGGTMESVTDQDLRAIAYTRAVAHVLGVEVEIEHYKQVALGTFTRMK